jgi:hypothetical protein
VIERHFNSEQIEVLRPLRALKIQTSLYADFIPDDYYLPAPEPDIVIVNKQTYDKIKAMSHAEFQFYVGSMHRFIGND